MMDQPATYQDALIEINRLQARVHELEERTRTQTQMLKTTQEAYHALAAHSLQGVLILQAGQVIFAGPGVESILGHPLDQLPAKAGHYLAGLVHPDDYQALRSVLAAPTAAGRAARLEVRLRQHSGAYRWALLAAHRVGQDGPPTVQVTFIDIHDLKSAEDALREREELFRRTFDQSPVGAAMVDRSLRFVRVNATLCHISGYSAEDLTARTVLDLVHPYDREAASDLWARLMDGEIDYFAMEQRYVQPDGNLVWVNLSVRMLEDAGGQRPYALPLMEDITPRKQAEAELRRSEQKYRHFVEQSTDAIWLFDTTGHILEWNRGAEQLTGLRRGWVMGFPIWDVLALVGDNAAAEAMYRGVHEGMAAFMDELPAGYVFSLPIRSLDGELRQTQMLIFPIINEDELLVGAITRDISERLQAEHDAIQLHLEKERTEMLTDFIRDASHEFRTPLSIINTNLYMLRRLMKDDMLAERLDTVVRQTEYLHDLLESMLTMTRLDSKSEWHFKLVPVGRLLDALHTRMMPVAEESGVALRISAPDDLPPMACDEVELYTALLALLTNAIHYTPMPGAVDLRVARAGEALCFTVSDTGIGIPPDALPHIFERFYRVDEARTRLGAGLGLCIARKIVEQHGGALTVESVVGKGSTFTAVMPLAVPMPAPDRAASGASL